LFYENHNKSAGNTTLETPEIRKSFCAKCNGLRNCDIRGKVSDHWGDGGVWGNIDWFLLQCRCCENIFCHTVKIFSEDYSYEWDAEAQEDTIVMDEDHAYCPAVSARKRPDCFASMNFGSANSHVLLEAMTEMYVALDNDLMRLSGAAIRTAFDIASELLGIDPDLTFAEKLDTLVSTNRINGVDRERLETLTEAGHASIHRGWVPKTEDLGTMVDILEHFVHRAFVEPTLQHRFFSKARNYEKGGRNPFVRDVGWRMFFGQKSSW
jgi:Domain of unknown function (DUF4145)